MKKIFSFEELVQNGKDAVSYAIQNFNERVIVMGSSQGGIVAIGLAGKDDRIQAAFPHNILISDVPESIIVTRFPQFLKHGYSFVISAVKCLAKVWPAMPIPVSLYLDLHKVSKNKAIIQQFYDDPYGFMSYPLYFLASLFSADLSSLRDGSIKCPVYVLAAKGDPLFPEEYTRSIFHMMKAPYKEMILFDENVHLILNECLPQVVQPIVTKLTEYRGAKR